MKPFCDHEPIQSGHTIDLSLRVADARQLVASLNATDPEGQLYTVEFRETVQRLAAYLAARDAGEHCFLTEGDPFAERHSHGYPVHAEPVRRAKVFYQNSQVIDGDRVVAVLSRRADGDETKPGDPGESRWFVYPVVYAREQSLQYRMALKPFGSIEQRAGGVYAVTNPGLPAVDRASYELAILTCYLRGRRAAENRAIKRRAAVADGGA